MRWSRLLSISAVGAALLVSMGGMALRANRDRFAAPEAVTGSEGVLRVHNLFVDFYVAKTAGGALLFDAGTDPGGRALDAALAASGSTRDEVRAVFLTHGHFDHLAAAPLLPRAKVFAGSPDGALMLGKGEHGRAVSRVFSTVLGISPVRGTDYMQGRREISVEGEAERVLAVPLRGHTNGSYAYLFRGVLFAGDALEYREGELRLSSARFAEDPRAHTRTVEALRDILQVGPITTICTGHTGCTPPGRGKELLEGLVRREVTSGPP